MKRPKTMKIGARIYQVDYVRHDGMDHDAGHVDHLRELVTVSTEYPLREQKLTLLHECLHAMHKCMVTADNEESVVGPWALNLFTFMRENKELMRWIMEERDEDIR